MNTDVLTVKSVFQKDIRYVVPDFQRPYVWTQEDQWEPLWDDVRNTAERYLEELGARFDSPNAQVEAEKAAGRHFLGAVVLQQVPTPTAEIEARSIIDGQQRLTTLQVVLHAVMRAYEVLGLAGEARRVSRVVLNDKDSAVGNPEAIFKVWPTNVDREAFKLAMADSASDGGSTEASLVEAHKFFSTQAEKWLQEDPNLIVQRAHGLETALLGLFQLVVIDLDQNDDAYVIFETMNARGTPLLESDLIKNYILHTADAAAQSTSVFKESLTRFEDPWWRKEIRQGRIVRPRVDVFLNYWLTMTVATEVQAGDVFKAFRRYADKSSRPIAEIAANMSRLSQIYRALDIEAENATHELFRYRWHVMDAGVVTPLLIWLFSRDEGLISQVEISRSLRAIESYFVRRMVCRMTTKDYNRLFLELLVELESAAPHSLDQVIVDFLRGQSADARVWPSDQRITDAFIGLPLYWLLTRGRLRMVLEGIEGALRTNKAEQLAVPRGLTIEHLLPQSWAEHWPLSVPPEAAEEAVRQRNTLVQTIGNLTLVNDKLNPALSNAAWDKKRDGIKAHSVLYLNKKVIDSSWDAWDEEKVVQRSQQLAELAVGVWPGPQHI